MIRGVPVPQRHIMHSRISRATELGLPLQKWGFARCILHFGVGITLFGCATARPTDDVKRLDAYQNAGNSNQSQSPDSIAFSPSGKYIAVGHVSKDGWIDVWETATYKLVHTISIRGIPNVMRFEDDVTILFSAGDSFCYRLSIKGGEAREINLGPLPSDNEGPIDFSVANHGVIVGPSYGSTAVAFINLLTLKVSKALGSWRACALWPERNSVVAVTSDRIALLELPTMREVESAALPAKLAGSEFQLALGHATRTVWVFTNAEVGSWTPGRPPELLFSAPKQDIDVPIVSMDDSQLVAVEQQLYRALNSRTGVELHDLCDAGTSRLRGAFSPVGSTVAVGTDDGVEVFSFPSCTRLGLLRPTRIAGQ